jgi:hypothetical protein
MAKHDKVGMNLDGVVEWAMISLLEVPTQQN